MFLMHSGMEEWLGQVREHRPLLGRGGRQLWASFLQGGAREASTCGPPPLFSFPSILVSRGLDGSGRLERMIGRSTVDLLLRWFDGGVLNKNPS